MIRRNLAIPSCGFMLLSSLNWKPPFFLCSCSEGFLKVEIWQFFARKKNTGGAIVEGTNPLGSCGHFHFHKAQHQFFTFSCDTRGTLWVTARDHRKYGINK